MVSRSVAHSLAWLRSLATSRAIASCASRVNKGRKEWRERFNHDVGSYFSAMYRGLKELMGSKADWKVERMGGGPARPALRTTSVFRQGERSFARTRRTRSSPWSRFAKASVQIKFDVALIQVARAIARRASSKTQLVLELQAESIGLSMVSDMRRFWRRAAVGCTEVPRRLVSKKGGVQSVSLLDTARLEATFSRDAGSLVPPANKLRSLRADIKVRIKELFDEGRLTKDQRDELRAAWDAFEADYIKAMEDFISTGLHGEAVMRQAESFAALASTPWRSMPAAMYAARKTVSEVSQLVRLASPATTLLIIPPWHPERMKALAVKTRRVAGSRPTCFQRQACAFWRPRHLLAGVLRRAGPPVLPEIAVLQRGGAPTLVSESSTVNGYSLLERPCAATRIR
jgi:S-DNA-T family DNA segregation ATPase FtsK/SpoIIIE